MTSPANEPSDASPEQSLEKARRLVAAANRIVFFTGAGLGAESGIPTFRGTDGLWRGVRAEELASLEGFQRDSAKVWEWYCWRRRIVAQAEPHAGHLAISRFCASSPGAAVVTQNVDGLHQRSGSSDVVELHGNIGIVRCLQCGKERADSTLEYEHLPRCQCGALERPAVVWFGEPLPEQPWQRAVDLMTASDLVIVVGTSAVVQPAASLIQVAAAAGSDIVEVNPEPALAGNAVGLPSTAATVLPKLLGRPGEETQPPARE